MNRTFTKKNHTNLCWVLFYSVYKDSLFLLMEPQNKKKAKRLQVLKGERFLFLKKGIVYMLACVFISGEHFEHLYSMLLT